MSKYFSYLRQIDGVNKRFSENYTSTYTLGQAIHNQLIFPLWTNVESIDKDILNLEKGEQFDDIYFYYYTKKCTLYPVLYNQIINLCGDDGEDCCNEKCIVFTCDRLIEKDILINKYVIPFISKIEDEEKKKSFMKSVFDNVMICDYSSNQELLYKIYNLYYLLQTDPRFREVSLVVIDGINLIEMQKINFSIINETRSKKRLSLNFKKKRQSVGSSNGKKSNELIISIFNYIAQIKEQFNFNLIVTCFDYDAFSFYNFANSGKMMFQERPKDYINIEIPKCYIKFFFKIPSFKSESEIHFVQPIIKSVNNQAEFFGLFCQDHENKGQYLFKVFAKMPNNDKIKEVYSKEIIIDN